VAKRDIDRLHDEIEELFSDLWQVPRFAGLRHGFRPQVDCFRTDTPPRLTVVVELPGIDSENVNISATPRALVITGERPRPKGSGRVYQQAEIDYGPFQRQIPLGEEVDTAGATATFERGLLTIELPIATGPVRVAIDVQARS
jgi:HSP20 family protein